MTKRNIVVIGASAGGVNALITLVKKLPANLDASIFVVLHINASTPSSLPEILSRFSPIPAVHPVDGEKIKRGRIYVAPPDHHLIIEKDKVLVRRGPKENRFRPSVDALFRSAAYEYGSGVIAVVLSGMLNDGTSGMWSVKRMGGIAIIQDPEDALYDSMPVNVLEYVDVDYVLPVAKIGETLEMLTNEQTPKLPDITSEELELMNMEVVIAAEDNAFEMGILNMGELTPFTCPECHGTLISIREGKTIRFRCHTGHAYSSSTLLEGVTQSVEEQLWGTMRTLEESVMLLEKIGKQFKEAGNEKAAAAFLEKAEINRLRSLSLQRIVKNQEVLSEDLRHEKDIKDMVN